jgi:hypothetical protein
MLKTIKTPWLALVVGAALAGTAAPVFAAGTDADKLQELQQKLDRSLQMIEALSARVRDLEAQKSVAPSAAVAAAGTASAPAATAERIDTVEQRVAQIETANATRRSDDTGLPLHGFADVSLGNYNPYYPEYKGTAIGNLDFYLTPKLGEHTRALFELTFEAGEGNSVNVDIERGQFGYQWSDAATLWVGRFHTPYGYANTALHHGSWISTALRRPKFLNFEDKGGVLPAHTVGGWLTGSQRAAGGKVTYDLFVGNSQKIVGGTLDMRSAGNEHGNVIGGGRLGYQFSSGGLDGLAVGLHAFTDKVDSDGATSVDGMPSATRLKMVGGYVVYDTDAWENMAEFYALNDEDLVRGTGSHKSNAGYVQLAYRAGWATPYVRYERASLQQEDAYFSEQSSGASYTRGALGLRFDLDPRSAVKFELANTRNSNVHPASSGIAVPEQYNEALAQYAIRF